MKKLINKIIISSGAIALLGAGGLTAIVNANTNSIKQTENLKGPNQPDNYSVSGYLSPKDRTYMLQLSKKSTLELYKDIDSSLSYQMQGNAVFNYLTTSWTKWIGKKFKKDLKNDNDYDSVHSLFEQTNPHTWKGGFSMIKFITLLNWAVKFSTGISINIYVDYVFLGHNLYGAEFF